MEIMGILVFGLTIGDSGMLSFQGTRYLGFERRLER